MTAKQQIIDKYAKKYNLSIEQIKEHYEIEKQLASRLRNSNREERQRLYTALYDELFKRVPYHPQLKQKRNLEAVATGLKARMQFLERFLNLDSIFIEIGPGDCSLSIEVAKRVKKVYAVDVSNEITKDLITPKNFELLISDGISIPVLEGSINVAYSDQLMEHLHPDDAVDQLFNIYKVLAPGGLYICNTPNRLSGPHDISQCFNEVATGFHLQEYLGTEMYQLFRKAGFSKVSLNKSYKKIRVEFPLVPATLFVLKISEYLLSALPFTLRRKLANMLILFRGMTVVGTK